MAEDENLESANDSIAVSGDASSDGATVQIDDFIDGNIAEVAPDYEDIAQVKKGQRSQITVTAFDVAQYGTLTGRIQKIAGNTIQPQGGAAYYETYVEIMDGRFSGTKRMANLVSGMEVVVDIVGDKRTILSYVLTPFNRAASLVFREN